MKTRSTRRIEFLTDILITAIENNGYGWFLVKEYDPSAGAESYAVICEYETNKNYRITLDTIAKGISIISNAKAETVNNEIVLVNAKGEILYFGGEPRTELLKANKTNGEDGDCDVISALAVIECSLFGRVVYG